jgi:hypothetical protein
MALGLGAGIADVGYRINLCHTLGQDGQLGRDRPDFGWTDNGCRGGDAELCAATSLARKGPARPLRGICISGGASGNGVVALSRGGGLVDNHGGQLVSRPGRGRAV